MATDTKILVINEVDPPDSDPSRTHARNTGHSSDTTWSSSHQENEIREFYHDPDRTFGGNVGTYGKNTRTSFQENETGGVDTYGTADWNEQQRLSNRNDDRNTSDFKMVHGYKIDLEAGAPYDKYIIVAAIVTVFCCWPIGICALINAFRARRAARLGDEEELARYTSWATTQIIWTVFAGFLVLMIFILFVVVRIQTLSL